MRFKLFWPDRWQKHQWNDETCGDIIESVSGYYYSWKLQGRGAAVPGAAKLVLFLDALVFSVYTILMYSPQDVWKKKDLALLLAFIHTSVQP